MEFIMQKGGMITSEYNDAVFFRITCDCTDTDHDVTLEFEDDDGFLSMHMYADIMASDYTKWGYPWWQNKYHDYKWRLKTAFEIIFKGWTKANHQFLLNKDNLVAFEDAIRYSKEKFKKVTNEN
jgi:hypothetical protein